MRIIYTDENIAVCQKASGELSEGNGANLGIGTDMKILGALLAEQYNLDFSYTKEIDEAIEHLKNGGRVIALVGGNRENYVGLFAKSGHYILLLSYDGNDVCILDPALSDTKYTEEGRVGRVRVDKPFVYSSVDEVSLATEAFNTRYFLFSRKSN